MCVYIRGGGGRGTYLESRKTLTFEKCFHKLCVVYALINEQALSVFNILNHVCIYWNLSSGKVLLVISGLVQNLKIS